MRITRGVVVILGIALVLLVSFPLVPVLLPPFVAGLHPTLGLLVPLVLGHLLLRSAKIIRFVTSFQKIYDDRIHVVKMSLKEVFLLPPVISLREVKVLEEISSEGTGLLVLAHGDANTLSSHRG